MQCFYCIHFELLAGVSICRLHRRFASGYWTCDNFEERNAR